MANYSSLLNSITSVIKANPGNDPITGPELQTVLQQMVVSMGQAGYIYKGRAIPTTDPGSPDQNVFYIATTPGTYTNFSSIVVAAGECAILKGSGTSWSKEATGIDLVSVSQNISTGKEELSIGGDVKWILDNEPEAGSDNLVKSKGVFALKEKNLKFENGTTGYIGIDGTQGAWANGYISPYILVKKDAVVSSYSAADNQSLVIAFYDETKIFVNSNKVVGEGRNFQKVYSSTAPQDGYVRCYTDKTTISTAWTDGYFKVESDILHSLDVADSFEGTDNSIMPLKLGKEVKNTADKAEIGFCNDKVVNKYIKAVFIPGLDLSQPFDITLNVAYLISGTYYNFIAINQGGVRKWTFSTEDSTEAAALARFNTNLIGGDGNYVLFDITNIAPSNYGASNILADNNSLSEIIATSVYSKKIELFSNSYFSNDITINKYIKAIYIPGLDLSQSFDVVLTIAWLISGTYYNFISITQGGVRKFTISDEYETQAEALAKFDRAVQYGDGGAILFDYPNIAPIQYSVSGISIVNNSLGDFIRNELTTSPLTGKFITLNGDSICAGAGYLGGYGKIIAEQFGMRYENIAVGGATIEAESYYPDESPRHWICRTIQNMNSGADYAILEGGVNGSAPLGELSTGFDAILDDTTFIGAFESMLKQLITRFSGKKYGYIAVHRMTTSFDYSLQNNRFGAAIECCKKWGVPYLDLNTTVPPFGYFLESGNADLYDLRETYTRFGDGWHPNEAGYNKYYVPKIISWLNSL